MSTTARQPELTPIEYLEREARADTRSEYLDGEVFAMSGASYRHNLIASRLAHEVRAGLPAGCEALSSDMRVKVEASGLYTYPDVVVHCGPAELETISGVETLTNPVVVFEVISPSTVAWDRGGKLWHYQ